MLSTHATRTLAPAPAAFAALPVAQLWEVRENRATGEPFVGRTGDPRCRWTKDLPG